MRTFFHLFSFGLTFPVSDFPYCMTYFECCTYDAAAYALFIPIDLQGGHQKLALFVSFNEELYQILSLHSNLLATDRQRRRKRSSSDLGINYPGDLLSQVKPKRPAELVPPLLKRNTVAEFAITRAYTSTASLFSAPPEQGTAVLCV